MNKKGFTLTEVLITLVILGSVSAILVQNLINRQVENANRAKVKKAMAAYEKAINFIILENDIKSTEELREFGEEENCKFSKAYFKTVQDGNNNCFFKTADRVWWNITDLTNPILILKDSQKDKTKTELQTLAKDISDKTVFALLGRFDEVSTLRVNDNGFEQAQEDNELNQKYMKKLWYFITQSDSILNDFDKCKLKNQETCKITVDGLETTYNRVMISEYTYGNGNIWCYNPETGRSNIKCNTTTTPGIYYVEKPSLKTSDFKTYEEAIEKCEKQGARLATMAELSEMWSSGALSCQNYWIWADNMSYNVAYTINCGLNAREGRTKERRDFFSVCISQ